MGQVRIYSSKGTVARICQESHGLTKFNIDVPNPGELLKTRRDSIARFIYVVRPIRDIFQLPPTSVHIFYDLAGSTIAFNRNASIFLNLRYFEAWRTYKIQFPCRGRSWIWTDDDLVRDGDLIEAYTSW